MPILSISSSYDEFVFSASNIGEGRTFRDKISAEIFARLQNHYGDIFRNWYCYTYAADRMSATFSFAAQNPRLLRSSEMTSEQISKAFCRHAAFQATINEYLRSLGWKYNGYQGRPDYFNLNSTPKGEWIYSK